MSRIPLLPHLKEYWHSGGKVRPGAACDKGNKARIKLVPWDEQQEYRLSWRPKVPVRALDEEAINLALFYSEWEAGRLPGVKRGKKARKVVWKKNVIKILFI